VNGASNATRSSNGPIGLGMSSIVSKFAREPDERWLSAARPSQLGVAWPDGN
jgi:hypothetical protein